MRFRLFTLAATVCVIGVSNFEVVSGAEDLETLLSMLEVRAKATSLVEWQYHSLQLTGMAIFELRTKYPGMDPFTAAHTAGITSFLRDERTISKGKGLVDLKSGKYRFDFVSNQPSNNKNAQAETRTIAYDGTSYSSFIAPQEVKKEKADAGPARTLAPVVEFSKEDLEATNTKVRLFVAGEMFMPSRVPLIPGTLDFRDISTSLLDFVSAVRRNKRIVQFESRSPERWVLRLPVTTEGKVNGQSEYVFDPQKGCCPVEVSWIQDGLPASLEYIFENSKWGEKLYGPIKITYIDWINGKGRQWTISEVILEPMLGPTSFSVDVPDGAVVQDHGRKMAYGVSKGPVDEARAMAQYAGTNKLNAGRQMVPRFYVWLIVSGVLGGAGLLFFLIRRWRGSVALFPIMCCLFSQIGCGPNTQNAVAIETAPVSSTSNDFVWDAGWKLAIDGEREISVTQCGLNVTTLALNILKKDFDACVVSKFLPPTTFGIRFSDIKGVLESHGVDVIARKNLTLKSIINSIDPGTVIIIHVPQWNQRRNKEAHYVGVSFDEDGKLMYLDPPREPIDLSLANRTQIQGLSNLTALFCRSSKKQSPVVIPTKSVIEFSSSDFISGELCGTISLLNPHQHAVLVSSVVKPCACVSLEFDPAVVRAGGTLEYKFRVDELQWGVGRQTKKIFFNSIDGNQMASVEFMGESKAASIATVGLRSVKKILDIPLNCGKAPLTLVHQFRLFDAKDEFRSLNAEHVDAWCVPKLIVKDGVWNLETTCTFDEPLLSQLSAGIPVETYVQVFAENKPTSVYTLSLLYRRDIELTYSAVGREIDSKNKILVLSIEVPLGQEWSEWDLSQVDFDASELEVGEIHRKSETEWEIELSEKKELDRPYVGFIYFKNSDSPPIKRAITVTSRVETRW